MRSGAVELLDGGRVLDLLGEGEMIGHPSMLSGLPATFEVQAAEDVLLYRLPAAAMAPGARAAGGRALRRAVAASALGHAAPVSRAERRGASIPGSVRSAR